MIWCSTTAGVSGVAIMSRDQLQGPQRIVSLTEETTDTLYLLGEHERIVGTSGFTVGPPQARKEKPTAAGVLRGVRQSLHLGDPLGRRTDRNRRRRLLSRANHRTIGQGPNHRRSERGDPPHHRALGRGG
jgi:hypothetical protein